MYNELVKRILEAEHPLQPLSLEDRLKFVFDDMQKEKEEKRKRKEEEDREQAELDLAYESPEGQLLIQTVKEAEDMVCDYDATVHEHRSRHGGDRPSIEFNVKLYSVHIPEEVTDFARENDLEDDLENHYSHKIQDQLAAFGDGIVEDHGIVKEWFQEGRGGGWLLFTLSDADEYTEGIADIGSVVRERNLMPEMFTRYTDNLKYMMRQLKSHIDSINKISLAVTTAHTDVVKYLGSMEAWEEWMIDNGYKPKRKVKKNVQRTR